MVGMGDSYPMLTHFIQDPKVRSFRFFRGLRCPAEHRVQSGASVHGPAPEEVTHFLYVPCFEYLIYIKVIKEKHWSRQESKSTYHLVSLWGHHWSPYFQAQMAPAACRCSGRGSLVKACQCCLPSLCWSMAPRRKKTTPDMEMEKSPNSESFGVNV